MDLQKHLLELNEQIDILRQEKESVEKSLRSEIKQLKEQVCVCVYDELNVFSCFILGPSFLRQRKARFSHCLLSCPLFKIASLVQSNVKMFEELQVYRCPDHSQQRLAKLVRPYLVV